MNADGQEDAARSPDIDVPGFEADSSAGAASSDPTGAASEPGAARRDYSIYHQLHADPPPLEDCLDTFWSAGTPLQDLPDVRPAVAEPYEILKRLGPSPFEGGGFPLIGFFATAYERVSRFARQRSSD